jgi:hypothetical protein
MGTFKPEMNDVFTYNPARESEKEAARRTEMEHNFDDFFDPVMDTHSAFYTAMERDKNAAHIVAGTSFLDLNSMILKTECNNAYESMNEEDMQRLRKLMWDVYVPSMKRNLENKLNVDEDENIGSFQAQMYVVHLSVRVAQALQLVFELNQKKSFSAVAKTAYEVALQDVLYHPSVKGRVASSDYGKLINYLRRNPTFSTAFNTYVGYKLLRQQLVRSGGAGTNRKSNDAERLHDEAANRLWSVLDENRRIYNDFKQAPEPYTMEWHHLYYKEVAQTLYHKLADYSTDVSNDHFHGDKNAHAEFRSKVNELQPLPAVYSTFSSTEHSVGSSIPNNYPSVDFVSAVQESRDTVAGGASKRVGSGPKGPKYTTATLTKGNATSTPIDGGGRTDTVATKRQRMSYGNSHGSDESPTVSPPKGSAGGINSLGGDDVDTGTATGIAGGDRVRRAYAAFFN